MPSSAAPGEDPLSDDDILDEDEDTLDEDEDTLNEVEDALDDELDTDLPKEQEAALIDEMEEWFRERYEDPAIRTPYESREGGYQWIWGGPYDAFEQLEAEFYDRVPAYLIQQLADHLSGESPEWAPIPSDGDYDEELLDSIRANEDPFATFLEATGVVRSLLAEPLPPPAQKHLIRLLYANVITALETYLSDSFINTVLSDRDLLRKFLETTPEFEKRTVPLSQVFAQVDSAPDTARAYLLNVVWHRLPEVASMYRDTLDISLFGAFGPLMKAMPTRHHVVHRNGRDKDGAVVAITAAQVEQLLSDASALVTHVEEQLRTLNRERATAAIRAAFLELPRVDDDLPL